MYQDKDSSKEEDVGREDVKAWKLGMTFIVLLMAAMFALGSLRGWDANSGHTHNTSLTSNGRFLPEPFEEDVNVTGRFGPEAPYRWHYWKLPPHRVTMASKAVVWLCYAFHQIFVWMVTYEAQMTKTKTREKRYTTEMAPFNWKALYVNFGFYAVHLLQTHVFYDALAQDVSVASSQGSVIMLLALVMLMEYRDRGLAFGWPTEKSQGSIGQKLRFGTGPVDFIRKYHGYGFAWAAVYTFWYHPMENTWAHATGFIYTWILMLQGSLMYTKLHLNRYWRLLLEFWVTVHSTAVAFQIAGPELGGTKSWPMFLCGFLWLFAMTQLFGLPFWKRLPAFTKILPFTGYLCFVVWLFSWLPESRGRAWVRMNEAVRIPTMLYILVVLAWFVMEYLLRIQRWAWSKKTAPGYSSVPKFVYILCFLLAYIGMIVISWLVQWLDIKFYLVPITLSLTVAYIIGTSLASVFLHQIFACIKRSTE